MINAHGRFRLMDNVQYVHLDRNGHIKPLFSFNDLGKELYAQGKISAQERGSEFGFWTEALEISNLVTTVGKALVAGRINGSGSPAAATYIAVGTGTTAAAIGDTTLETEITDSGLQRASATVSLATTDTANDTAQLVLTYTVTGTKAVTESGVLNASSSGTLLARQVFAAINVVSGDSLQITWKFDVD